MNLLWTVRVYALVVHASHVLIHREWFAPAHQWIWKFPGGGIESTESLKQALHREWEEEAGGEFPLQIGRIFYIADIPVFSAYTSREVRVLSIYFLCQPASSWVSLLPQKHPAFSWIPLCLTEVETLSLLHDRHAFLHLVRHRRSL